MSGGSFRLPGVAEPIPCPRCGRTDCARVETTKRRRIWWCGTTWRDVSRDLLRRYAMELGLTKHRATNRSPRCVHPAQQ
ncbi:MAG TPA: hypothetical protein VJ793_22420 [Anaerolineae bacterium]|nr:hypothetical protein [Anaerolineae bacterium]